jgi:hypothetical protein
MASTYSTDLAIELMTTGENSGTWGTKTNTNWQLIEQAVAGYQAVSIAGGAQTTALAMTNATLSNARNAVISLTGTITGNQIVTIPDGVQKTYIIFNNTSGAFTVLFKNVSGTGFTWSAADKGTRVLYSDGTNIYDTGIVSLTGVQTLTNKTLTLPTIASSGSIIDANTNPYVTFAQTTSAVNQITVTNAATTNNPSISATGTDSNVGLTLAGKGTGLIKLTSGGYFPDATLTFGTTITWDVSTSPVAKVTLTASTGTLSAPTNGVAGQFISLTVIQDGTGSRTLTWNSAYSFTAATAPTLTTTASQGDLFVFKYDGTKWLCVGTSLNLVV